MRSLRLLKLIGILAVFCLWLAGCNSGPSGSDPTKSGSSSRPSGPNPKVHADWVETLDPLDPTPAVLMNGQIGFRLNRFGTGEPGKTTHVLRRTSQEQYTLENPINANLTIDGKEVKSSHLENYRQVLEFRTGLVTTTARININGKRIDYKCLTKLPIDLAGIGTEISLDFHHEGDLKLSIPKGERPPVLGWNGFITRIVCSYGDDSVLRNPATNTFEVKFKTGSKFLAKVGAAFSASGDNASAPVDMSHSPPEIGLDNPAVDYSKPNFAVSIEGPTEDQQAINSFLFYLSSSVPKSPPNGLRKFGGRFNSYGPMGLSSPTYNFRMFWDADIWVFPALMFLDPDAARSIPLFRISQEERAKRNFQFAYSWAREKPDPQSLKGIDAVQYPWETGPDGREASPTETKQQHHITGSVMFGLWQAAALGLVDSAKVNEIGRKAANFYEWRATNPAGAISTDGTAQLLQTVSPDEFHFGDNDRYTNVMAEFCVKTWKPESKIKRFVRPERDGNPLNYDGDRGRSYKQTAGLLAVFPLQDPESESKANQMMELYADKVTENGPAMSESVHATIWARLGETERAYESWKRSWQPYTDHPLLLFSEKKNKEVTYFCTGAGGCLQTVLYGFLGFRLDSKKLPGAAWSAPLRNGMVLSIKPNLPKAWKRVTLKNFVVLGKRYTLTATHENVTVTPGEE